MSLFGDRDASVEEVSRNNRIKKAITKQLAAVLKSLQKEYGGAGLGSPSASLQPIYSGDLPSHLCLCVEAVFLHGLKKAKFRRKWSGYFGGDGGTGSDSDPQSYSFWPFVIKFTHKDTVAQLKRSQHLKCEVGLCRAWVRAALNECLLESYLSAALSDGGSTAAAYYRPVAYLRDAEQASVLLGLLRGLGELAFALSYNMPSLNAWTTATLALAGFVESGLSGPTTASLAAAGAAVSPPPLLPSSSPTVATAVVHDWTTPSRLAPAAFAAAGSSPSAFGGLRTGGDGDGSSSRLLQLIGRPGEDSNGGLFLPAYRCPASGELRSTEESVSRQSGSDPVVGRNDYCITDYAHRIAVANDVDIVSAAVCNEQTACEHAAQVPGGSLQQSLRSGDHGGNGDDEESLSPPLVYSISSGRRNPFLASSDVRHQALSDEPLLVAEASGGSGSDAGQQCHRKVSADLAAGDRDASSYQPYDTNCEEQDSSLIAATTAATSARTVPRPRMEPVTGNSLGSLSGWASALGPADVADEPPAASGGQAEPGDSVRSSARFVGSDGSMDRTPGGSPEYAASFDELMREYRPGGWSSAASAHQAALSSDVAPPQQPALEVSALQDASTGARGPGSSSNGGGSSGLARFEEPTTEPATAVTATIAPLGRQSPDSDYEVLDPYDGQLAEDVGECYGKICSEKGLDSQNYQCKDCGRPVGIVYGTPRVCTYDGCYYCMDCHANEECLIPAKVVFNWDFKRYKVSKRCKAYLQSAEDRPLLIVSQLNAKLYDHVPELQECRMLRVELCCLRKYLFQCAHQIAEKLKRQVWPNEFLYDDPDTYSVSALALVMSGQLASGLRKAVAFAKAHVYDCVICRQKGFFCELCGSSKVIFPFETDSTVQCDKCRAVYHKACRRNASGCSKCARIRKRQEALGAQHEAASAMLVCASLY